jgi:peroxiredoxin
MANGDESLQRRLKIHQLKKSLFIKTYIDSIQPTLAVFYMKDFLNPEEEMEYLTGLSQKIDTVLAKSKYTKAFSNDLQEIKNALVQKEQSTQNASVAVGMPAPEIALPDPNGKVIPLSSLKGKFVLIDFWASWCGPCRAENPHVKRVYDQYKGKGLEIYGVSLDADKRAWTNAIDKDQLPWLHVSDLKYWNSSVVAQYGIEGIPATFLLDKKGVIIARNLRGEELSAKLAEVLK